MDGPSSNSLLGSKKVFETTMKVSGESLIKDSNRTCKTTEPRGGPGSGSENMTTDMLGCSLAMSKGWGDSTSCGIL